MSLTGELRSPTSRLRGLLGDHLPGVVAAMRAHLTVQVAAHPLEPVPAAAGAHPSSLGHAISERLVFGRARRGDLAHSPGTGTAVFHFTRQHHNRMANPDILFLLYGAVTAKPSEQRPADGPVLPENDPDIAARIAVLLGLIDQAWRSQGPLGDTLTALLDAPDMPAALALVDHRWVEDVAAVAGRCLPVLEAVPGRVIVAPTLTGSALVGAAEGDLIIGSTLVEVKAAQAGTLTNWQYLQILMYALLDVEDEYALTDVAVLLARHGLLVRWDIDDVLRRGGGLTRAQARERVLAPLLDGVTLPQD